MAHDTIHSDGTAVQHPLPAGRDSATDDPVVPPTDGSGRRPSAGQTDPGRGVVPR